VGRWPSKEQPVNILVLIRTKPIRDQVVVGLQNFSEFSVEVGEGFSGLNRTHQKQFDAVFIGCSDGESEGLQMIERFRSYDEKTELVAVSDVKQAKLLTSQRSRFNITSILQVPVDPEDFFRVVARLRRNELATPSGRS
jgi:DNA-binding NtrC family response regulator